MSRPKHSLQEHSEIYYERAEIYDELSAAEDADGLVVDFLRPLVCGKRLLDVGCGTGKYMELLAPLAQSATGIDAARAQLSIAQERLDRLGLEPGRAELILGDAAHAAIPGSYDVAIACWMLGTTLDPAKRLAILEKIDSLLTPGGQIILIENDCEGEFELLRGRCGASRAYNDWLQDEAGFLAHARFSSRFVFASASDAARVMGAIWGPAVGAHALSPQIDHSIVALTRSKRQA